MSDRDPSTSGGDIGETDEPTLIDRIGRFERRASESISISLATRRRLLQSLGLIGLGGIGRVAGRTDGYNRRMSLQAADSEIYNWADPGGYSGPDSRKSEVDPTAGRIYKARDTGGTYHGNGTSWELLPGMHTRLRIPTTFSDTTELKNSYERESNVPLEFVGVENLTGEGSGASRGPAVMLRSLDDELATRLLLHDGSDGTAEKSAYIGRYNADRDTTSEVLKVEPNSVELEAEVPGEQLNLQEAHTTSQTEALMTFQTSDSEGGKATRMDISGGEELAHIRTRRLDEFRFGAIDPDGGGKRDVSAKARFASFAGHNYFIRNDNGRLRFKDEVSGDFMDLAGNGKLDLRNLNGLRGPPEYNNADSDELQNYEVAFDTNRAGTGETALLYKDSSGETHYWDADGTL